MESKDRLTAWFLANYGLTMKIALEYSPSADLVSDIVQSVYIEFLADAADENDPQALLRLLRRATRRIAKRHWDERHRNKSEIIREIGRHFIRINEARFEEKHFEEELVALKKCLEKLSEKNRQLIEMHYLSGNTSASMGAHFGVTARAINKAIYKIREKLRICIVNR